MCPEGLGLEQRGQTDFPPLPPGNGYILQGSLENQVWIACVLPKFGCTDEAFRVKE